MMHIIGIDGGLKGAIASLANSSEVFEPRLTTYYMPLTQRIVKGEKRDRVDGEAVRNVFEDLRRLYGQPDMIYLEESAGVTKQSAARANSFGVSVGIIEGIAIGLHMPITLVKAVVWKRHPSINLIGQDKNASRAKAGMVFPRSYPSFGMVKDDGVAEAALIAYYGWLQELTRCV